MRLTVAVRAASLRTLLFSCSVQLISSVGRCEGCEEHRSSKVNLAAALGAALAAAGLASGAVAVAVALHAAVVAVRDWRDLSTGSLKIFSEHSGLRYRLNTSLN